MRRLFITAGALLALAAAPPAGAATVTVRIVKAGFSPATVAIQVDDTVVWRNADTVPHQVVAENGSFASPVLRPGQSFRFTFRAAGTFRYRDALEPAERGTVTVRGRPPAVALGVMPSIVRYGEETHLQGAISSRRAGETVTLFHQPYGQAAATQLTVAVTTTGGVFDVVVKPTILTTYRAQFRTATSQPVTAQVRPRLTLLPAGRRTLKAQVLAPHSYAGRWIYLQRKTRFGQWISVSKLKLGPRSGRIFRVAPRSRTTYRVFMTVNQAGAGYLESWSGTQVLRPRR